MADMTIEICCIPNNRPRNNKKKEYGTKNVYVCSVSHEYKAMPQDI